ncbi:RHS repeat domain-containing protein [Selenomonas ruminantium]|uniref:RHS repeat domain-containing protein n=1 Tax=Selenomonas ruminantium TaxID=971 RepID=UPI00210D3F66|nr:RHS repeat-associated core domain-containing protein [Selenomonas ruminantium]
MAYRYGELGRKISQTDITGRQVNYRFDKSNQLVDICNEFDQSIVSFARDADGAIQKITHANGMWQDIAYDADKNIVSLTVATPDKILAQNTYRYDGNGQRIEKNELTGQTLYTYDKLNRLQQAEYPTDTERFTYDNAGNRLTRMAKDIEERYIYDVNNRLTSQTVNGRGETYRYNAEGLRCEMEGNEKAEQIPNRYQYIGQQLDPITQQYYLRARFYNPAIARFTQEDEYHGDGINLYAYCANNPVDYYDPSGYDKLIIKPDENIINGFSQEDIEKLMANSIQRNYTKLKSNVASVVEKFYNKWWTKKMEKMVDI